MGETNGPSKKTLHYLCRPTKRSPTRRQPSDCPGVRPIGIGETVHRIIGKAVLAVIKYDILDAAGAL